MNREGRKPVPLIERLYDKIMLDHPRRCWEWTANRHPRSGYGQIKYQGRNRLAHRVSYEFWHGVEIPPNMQIMHRCDNPPCVNPYHLEIGTSRDNIRDKHTKGRAHPQQGTHNNAGAKLTDAQVQEIRARVLTGEVQRRIAKDYGVSQSIVSRIKRDVRRTTDFGVIK